MTDIAFHHMWRQMISIEPSNTEIRLMDKRVLSDKQTNRSKQMDRINSDHSVQHHSIYEYQFRNEQVCADQCVIM